MPHSPDRSGTILICDDVLEVVGGAGKGGIIVRTGKDTSAPEYSERLCKGAKIRVVEATASRVGYELVSGDGPHRGWVTTKFQGKDLLAKTDSEDDNEPLRDAETVHSSEADSQDVFEEYCKRFGQQPKKEFLGFNRKPFPWGVGHQQADRKHPSERETQLELEKEMGLEQGTLSKEEARTPAKATQAPRFQLKGWAEDSDGEDVRICAHCKLPLGDYVYNRGRDCVHGECMAQLMVQDLRSEEKARLQRERAQKIMQHSAYGIGWKTAHIPRNDAAASKLAMRDVPQGMVCLVHHEASRSVRVASTMEPSAAMNLEYLSTALQVRRTEGHEPIFSLDPVNADEKHSMQEKVFVPEWLAGTRAGEVLFQSDYHLKELSMGEFEQPVVGMKSCFDFSEIDGKHGWSAREWFLVRKAEVRITDNSMLIPFVKMAVEAREQVVVGNSLEDKPVTQKGHPMVKYAEAFTQYFDLIAERKSVVFHLRELAKASVIAKYLLDSRIQLEDSWFNLAKDADVVCSLEVPQLWNERTYSQVHMKEGTIQRDHSIQTHGVYGGVQFGLDKFNLATSVGRPGAAIGTQMMPQHRLPFGLSRKAGIAPVTNVMALASGAQFAPPSASLSGAMLPPARLGAALSAASIGAPRLSALSASIGVPGGGLAPRLQGVDLRLDRFDLSEAKRVSLEAHAGSWGGQVKTLDDCIAVGSPFFAAIDGSRKLFSDDDEAFLRKVFNPNLTDRRAEEDLFVPPDASYSYVQKLRVLVKEEDAVRERRTHLFFSKDFKMGKPGTLFPHSWTSSFEIADGSDPVREGRAPAVLISRPEYKEQGSVLLEHLKASAPLFEKSTEDGIIFRVHRLGSLDVRTMQEPGGNEIVGAVFSMRDHCPNSSASKAKEIEDKEKITKVTEYVECAFSPVNGSKSLRRRYYLVLETEKANKVVTERLNDGRRSWIGNPENLEDRNSLAKLTRSDRSTSGVTVHDMVAFRAKMADGATSSSKRYVQATFNRVVGLKRNARKSFSDISLVLPRCFPD